jgi:hypothetical protein
MIRFWTYPKKRCPLIRDKSVASLAPVAAGLLLGIFLCGIHTGCGDDNNGAGFKPAPVVLPPSSPDNVMNNLVVCYNNRDIGQLADIFHEDFAFRFTEHDMLQYAELFPVGGVWGKSEELQTTGFMFDRRGAPADSMLSIANISITLNPSTGSVPCNLVGAPPGTIEKMGYLRLNVTHKTPDMALSVISRPLFYFVPDNPDSAKTWKIWMIEDEEPADAALGLGSPSTSTPVPIERVSWGWLRGLYWHYLQDH